MTRSRLNARPLLLGHRGARALKSIPENTLASFDQALADGCDGFEFDVRLSADGKPVVCHDPQTGGIEIARASGEQLAALPQLQDVLARYQARAFLDVELKVPGLEKITAALLRKSPPRRGFVVSSFLPEVLQTFHAEDSTMPLGLICETKAELSLWRKLPIEYVIPHHKLAEAALIRKIGTAGKRMLVWTVNAPADMQRFAESGVDGIISDDTVLLRRLLTE
jgi:glycerophosphoryl diester phosphodiesterase